MEEVRSKDVTDGMLHLTVEDSKVDEEFLKDYGSRLRLVQGASLIQQIGNELQCSIITITKAQILYHRFQRLKRDAKHDTLSLVAACLHLSIKLCLENVTMDDVSIQVYHLHQEIEHIPRAIRQNPSPESLQDMKKTLHAIEHFISTQFHYKIDNQIAHMYIYKFLAQLQFVSAVRDDVIITIATTVTKLLSTYYLCDGCLDFDSDEIAIACLQFAFLYCGCITSVDASVKYLLRKELNSVERKERIRDILDELILVSDISTTLEYI